MKYRKKHKLTMYSRKYIDCDKEYTNNQSVTTISGVKPVKIELSKVRQTEYGYVGRPHYSRVPILVIKNRGYYYVVDGNNRVVNAISKGHKTIMARILTEDNSHKAVGAGKDPDAIAGWIGEIQYEFISWGTFVRNIIATHKDLGSPVGEDYEESI